MSEPTFQPAPGKGHLNWRRGLLRLWIVASICWVSSIAWIAWDDDRTLTIKEGLTKSCIEDTKAQGGNPFDCFDSPEAILEDRPRTQRLIRWSTIALLPPTGALLVMLAALWVAAGFARDRESV